ncbi:hypothetical protein [Gottfriedia luciferensis]|uniref:hypothetical protein n=1 Tax=Gottfriedia luciferensis TaxID=178774 RepID=UPI000B432D60|nr:hypothetical protein [Gottfriedia luciferensis]
MRIRNTLTRIGKMLLICIICFSLFGCNKTIKSIKVSNNQEFKVYKISNKNELSNFLKELSWKTDKKPNITGLPNITLNVKYKNQDKTVKYSVYIKSVGTATIFSSDSKEGYANLNNTQTKKLKEIVKQNK